MWMKPSLLTLVNSKGETALHIAARHAHSETVRSLLTFSKTREAEDKKVNVESPRR
ncbi:Non-specific serine/threonine protein kinase [Bertholletia excelsa]